MDAYDDYIRKRERKKARLVSVAPDAPPPSEPAASHRELTDVGLAERFADAYSTTWRYFVGLGWHRWTGTHWAPDESEGGLLVDAAINVARCIRWKEAEGLTGKELERLLSFSRKAESRSRIEAMLYLASKKLWIDTGEIDKGIYLLNFRNCTVDLRTGAQRPHAREDYLTHCVDCDYDPSAQCPTWTKFLEDIFLSDSQMVDFVHRSIGYGLSGDTSEQCLFVLHGGGANGKSTLMSVVMAIAGNLGHEPRFDSFLAAKHGRNGTDDIASWRGKRILFASEANPGAKLDEAMIKSLTGGERITARHLYRQQFTFTPTAKVFLACNAIPHIRGTDDGIWRRIRIVPFQRQIPEAQRDPYLTKKLLDEKPGICAAIVRGSIAWAENGLQQPDSVRAATTSYRYEEDTIGRFLSDCAVLEESALVSTSTLYSTYKLWADSSGEHPLSATTISRYLRQHGKEQVRDRTGTRCWRGIRIQSLYETKTTSREW